MAITRYIIVGETSVANVIAPDTIELGFDYPVYQGITEFYFPDSGVAATVISVIPPTPPAIHYQYKLNVSNLFAPSPGEPVIIRVPQDLLQAAVAQGISPTGAGGGQSGFFLQITDAATGQVYNIPVVLQ